MSVKRLFLFPLVFCFLINSIFASDSEPELYEDISRIFISAKEMEAYLCGEHNRGFNYYGEMSLIGAIELEHRLKLRGGISLGKSAGNTDLNTFINTSYYPFYSKFLKPLNFCVSYISNSFIEYEVNTHSILPFVSYNAERAGISIGNNLRITSFFGETVIFESIITYYTYFNFISTALLTAGAGFGTFSDFHAKDLSAYSLRLYAIIILDKSFSILNEIEFLQSGGYGLTTVLYGFSWRGGVKYSW
ncbi:MAG: hypothetical protein FWD40_08930 [Treponema sp.]|nr:hypothetical protein [Treponema sp.]